MNEVIIQAASLYKDALEENKAELLIPLENCEIVYVPSMPHSHRSIWIEANLIIFYKTLEELASDFLPVSASRNGTRRDLYCHIINDDKDIDYHVTNIASGNLQHIYVNSLKPTYIKIAPQLLLKILKLLTFT